MRTKFNNMYLITRIAFSILLVLPLPQFAQAESSAPEAESPPFISGGVFYNEELRTYLEELVKPFADMTPDETNDLLDRLRKKYLSMPSDDTN